MGKIRAHEEHTVTRKVTSLVIKDKRGTHHNGYDAYYQRNMVESLKVRKNNHVARGLA